ESAAVSVRLPVVGKSVKSPAQTSSPSKLESVLQLVQPSIQSLSSANAPVSEFVTAAAGPSPATHSALLYGASLLEGLPALPPVAMPPVLLVVGSPPVPPLPPALVPPLPPALVPPLPPALVPPLPPALV